MALKLVYNVHKLSVDFIYKFKCVLLTFGEMGGQAYLLHWEQQNSLHFLQHKRAEHSFLPSANLETG